jgi:hypothetical protein
MSSPQRPEQSDFIAEAQRLTNAVINAADGSDREFAEHELAMFLRLNAQGRLAEWFASRPAEAPKA